MSTANSSSFPQMNGSYSLGRGYNPISELMRAIILRAVEDLNSPGELRDEAIAFFNEDDTEDETDEYIFSFISICKNFGFDPDKTRSAILDALENGRRIRTRRRAA